MRCSAGIIVLIVCLSSSIGEAQACTCGVVTLERQLELADYVFAGTVLDVDTLNYEFLIATIAVDEVWKGNVPEEFEVWTWIRSANCGYNDPWARFEIGVKFILYAFDPSDYLDHIYTYLCTRNKKYEQAGDDLSKLGPGSRPVAIEKAEMPSSGVALGPAYPNPASSRVHIPFTLTQAAEVEVAIYDLLGRAVGRVVSGYYAAGDHRISWDTRGWASGLYVYRLRRGETTIARQMLITR